MTSTEIETQLFATKCRLCGFEWQAPAVSLPMLSRPIVPTICAKCDEQKETEYRQQIQKAKEANKAQAIARKNLDWQNLCPREYRLTTEGDGVTELHRLELECKKLSEVLAWKYNPRGLLLVSKASGMRKTRAAWRLLRRMFIEDRTIAHYTAGAFQRRAQDEAGRYQIDAWFNTLARLDLIFLDDLGKGHWTENTEALFFDLVEHRTRDGRPMLITTNYKGEELIQGSRSEAMAYTVRRLKEFCEVINLD